MRRICKTMLTSLRAFSRPAKLLLLAIFLDGLFFSGWNLFFNLYILAAGFDRQFLGLVNTATALAGLLFGVPAGLLASRIGYRRAMIAGFALSSLALIIQALALHPAIIFIAGFLSGPFSQLYVLSQAPFMMKVSDDKTRDLLFSLGFGLFPLASAAGNLLAGQGPALLNQWLNLATDSADVYRLLLLISILLSLTAILPMLLIRLPQSSPAETSTEPGMRRAPASSLWRVLARPQTLRLALPNLLIGFGAALLVPYMNVFFAERYSLDERALGLLFSLSSLLTGLACLVGPRLVGNLGGKVRVVLIGQTASLFFLMLIGFSPTPWGSALGFLVRGALMNMVVPLFDAFALEQTPESEHSAINSMRALAWSVGWAIGPYISGVVQQQYGFTPLFISMAILYAIAILFTWVFFGRPSEHS